jgi:hypothetical protein
MEELILQADNSEDFFLELFLQILVVEDLEPSIDGDDNDGGAPHASIRKCLPGGVGTGRDNLLSPRPFLPSINREKKSRHHFGMTTDWGRIFFSPVGCCASASW